MTRNQFEREKNCGAALAAARSMLSKGIINKDDYNVIYDKFTAKYRPIIGGLHA